MTALLIVAWMWLGGAIALLGICICVAREEDAPVDLDHVFTCLAWPVFIALDLIGFGWRDRP